MLTFLFLLLFCYLFFQYSKLFQINVFLNEKNKVNSVLINFSEGFAYFSRTMGNLNVHSL